MQRLKQALVMRLYLNDFKCVDCSDIIHGMWVYDAGIWIPEKTDAEKKIVVTLEKRQESERFIYLKIQMRTA